MDNNYNLNLPGWNEPFKKEYEVDDTEEIDSHFQDIDYLSSMCRFSNCSHEAEPDCAVKKAIKDRTLSDQKFYDYLKLKKEAQYINSKKNITKAIDYMKQRKTSAKTALKNAKQY